MLRYEYGAFVTTPGANRAIHVTPAYRKISQETAILPRYMHSGGKVEGLGGGHDVSSSSYVSPEDAMNALIYMYRIWQLKHGIIDESKIIELALGGIDIGKIAMRPRIEKMVSFYFSPGQNYAPDEIIGGVCAELGHKICKNPIVMGDKWADYATHEDFAAIVFDITEKYLFTGWKRGRHKVKNNLPFSGFPGFDLALNYMQRNGGLLDGETVFDFYRHAATAIKNHEDAFDPYANKYPGSRMSSGEHASQEKRIDAAWFYFWGRSKNDMRYYLDIGEDRGKVEYQGNQVSLMDDFTLDFNPRTFDVVDSYQYYLGEREIRIFAPITGHRWVDIYTIDGVLDEATRRSGGTEPLFFPHQDDDVSKSGFDLNAPY